MENTDRIEISVSGKVHPAYYEDDVVASPPGCQKPVVYNQSPGNPNIAKHGGKYGVYACECGSVVELSALCRTEEICILYCPGCKFKTYIAMGIRAAFGAFLRSNYRLPPNFLNDNEI